MTQFTVLPPDELLERAQQVRDLGDLWREVLCELADAMEALAKKRQGQGSAPR